MPGPGKIPSVLQHPDLVEDHIAEEIEKGRLMGPVPEHLILLCHCSPMGLIPKPHQPGRWRLIVDLSSLKGHSVNDAISTQVAHMHYASVLDAGAGRSNQTPWPRHVDGEGGPAKWPQGSTSPCRRPPAPGDKMGPSHVFRYPLVFVPHRKSSQHSLAHWPGSCTVTASARSCTTWTTSCSFVPPRTMSVPPACRQPCECARGLESL